MGGITNPAVRKDTTQGRHPVRLRAESLMYALLLLLIAPDVDRLNDPVYGRREQAEYRLRAWGPLAWPALLAGERSDSPEVRHRCGSILGTYRAFRAEIGAAAVLLGPEMPACGPDAFCDDWHLRRRVYRQALAAGCNATELRFLLPETSVWWQPWGCPPWWSCWETLREVRGRFRGEVVVPMLMPGR